MAAHSDDFIDPDDIGVNASTEPSIGDLIERRLSRRDALRGLAGVSVATSLGSPFASTDAQAQVNGPSTLTTASSRRQKRRSRNSRTRSTTRSMSPKATRCRC